MELKPLWERWGSVRSSSLNRTFYGIETHVFLGEGADLLRVLIVPFMELKHEDGYSRGAGRKES